MSVSVIIPIYNAEDYIECCVSSIVSQTYPVKEIILVDDGSKDHSSEICDTLAEKFEQVKVIHQENAGVSAARNKGIECATGDFVCFIDSDDYAENDLISALVEAQQKNDADIIFGGLTYVYCDEHDRIRKKTKDIPATFSGDMIEFLKQFDKYSSFLASPCKILYRREILINNNIRFPQGIHIGEDQIFVANYMLYCDSVCAVENSAYQYILREEESLSKKRELTPPDYIMVMGDYRTQLMKKHGIDCGDREYARCYYKTVTFNFSRVFSKVVGFSVKEKFAFCRAMTQDEDTIRYAELYEGIDTRTKIMRELIKHRCSIGLYAMWTIYRRIINKG